MVVPSEAGPFAGWDEAQRTERARLATIDVTAPELLEVLGSCIGVELGRLSATEPSLVAFVDQTAELLAQFLPVDGIELSIAVPGVPAVIARRGAVAEGGPVRGLRSDGTPVGTLTFAGLPDTLATIALGRVVEMIERDLGTVLTREAACRARVVDRLPTALEGLDDWQDEDRLQRVASCLGCLPMVTGVEISVAVPGAGRHLSAVEARRPMPGDIERLVIFPDGGLARIGLDLAGPLAEGQRATVELALDLAGAALERAEHARRTRVERDLDDRTGLLGEKGMRRAVAALVRRAQRRGEQLAVVHLVVVEPADVDEATAARAVAGVLTELAPEAILGRVGRGRFVLGAQGFDGLDARTLVERAEPALAEIGIVVARHGIAVFPDHAGMPDALWREAERAAD